MRVLSHLCNPAEDSPPGSSVHGILQARILECVTILLSFKIKPDKLILASCMNSSQAKDDLYEFSFKYGKDLNLFQLVCYVFFPAESSVWLT